MKKTWREIKQDFLNARQQVASAEEAESQFRYVFDYFMDEFSSNSWRLAEELTKEQLVQWQAMLPRLMTDEPIQYILGESIFYDLPLEVNPSVLIPRQETEELVHWIVQSVDKSKNSTLLDIGTGSGAIALALVKNLPHAEVWGIDISPEAIQTAKRNAKNNAIDNVHFRVLDMHKLTNCKKQWDVIVSNPPYIDPEDRNIMEANVLEYEPDMALFAPENDALYFYRLIAQYAYNNLTKQGQLFFEINEFYKDELEAELEQIGFQHIETKKDLNGLWRMVRANL